MIIRNWHGRVPAAKAAAYLDLMRDVAIPDYRKTPGNLGAWALSRPDGDIVHVEMLTFWTSLDVIRAFAGDEVQKAKYYDFDADYLLEMEPTVRHYDAIGEAPRG
ncbi:antibiotic biosynthesis monooxygenase [Caulobacter sp. 1776]|uniref:antibiotic biosynthesis monooxygenase n=1 Tax=Caulobacter sp. 1776 TaxID=3156420 RepID=UPI003391F7D1